MDDDVPFAEAIDRMPEVVASGSLEAADWNAELLDGDLLTAVKQLTAQPGRGISLGGVRLPTALAAAGLVDEYTFVVPPARPG